jgi:hypothetical protein
VFFLDGVITPGITCEAGIRARHGVELGLGAVFAREIFLYVRTLDRIIAEAQPDTGLHCGEERQRDRDLEHGW